MFAHDLHVSLAIATIVAVAAAAIEASARAFTGRAPGRFSAATSGIVVVVVGMTAAGGVAMLARGERPRELLHFIYAALALALVPIGDSLTARANSRRRAIARLVAALATLGVIARLFATG